MVAAAIRQAPEFAVFSGVAVELPADAPGRGAAVFPSRGAAIFESRGAAISPSRGAAIFESRGAAICHLRGAAALHWRWALEEAWLRQRGVAAGLARLAAARAAAQYIQAEAPDLSAQDRAALPGWVPAMAADLPPAALPDMAATAAEQALIRRLWHRLGSADALMETGGDIRLARDPVSGLNGYGCSHRPRPWAITFASSTASSSSARGYVAADRARLRDTRALLCGAAPARALRISAGAVRASLTRLLKLPAGTKIILAASGTDTELMALALAHLAAPSQPLLSLLIAPEETGRGVPRAACGRHFAADTACGHAVAFATQIEGFPDNITLDGMALRDAAGAARGVAEVDAEVTARVAAGIAAGERVVLHALDLSKTGLLAPSLPALAALRARFGSAFDVVVDACQARLSPGSLAAYLALGATVLVTGSKFLTGPPFAGALLLPPAIAARLHGPVRLPAGLAAYFGRDDLYPGCPAAAGFAPGCNYGLLLRWHAATAELRALSRIPGPRRAAILAAFAATVHAAIEANPAFTLIAPPPVIRHATDEPWERCQTIFTFTIAAPPGASPGAARPLDPAQARHVYEWLNTDLSSLLTQSARLAARICHIGQPVALPCAGGQAGALRVSAGARLLSGEPAHSGLRPRDRLARELADLRTVFDKIELIRRHWALLLAAAPAQRYRPFALTASPKTLPLDA
jgi:hypothetical protein